MKFALEHFGEISFKPLRSQIFREISAQITGWKEMQNDHSHVDIRVMKFYLVHVDINRL